MNKKKGKKKRKISFKKVFRFFLLVILCVIVYFILSHMKISNIYISGNSNIKDQEIIRLAGLEDYPSLVNNGSLIIRKRLKSSDMIIDAKVKIKFAKVYIEVLENRPLFYDKSKNKTIMLDKKEMDMVVTPYLLNYVPDTIYDEFVEVLSKVNQDILERISDIEYNPNTVDSKRFYLSMTDGNYVYLTLNSFTRINGYIDMVKQFNGRKGILYLDSGGYFEIKE